MDNFHRFHWQVRISLISTLIIDTLLVAGVWTACEFIGLDDVWAGIAGISAGIIFGSLAVNILLDVALSPLQDVWRGLLHIDPHHTNVPAPNTDSLRYGRELVNGMLAKIYQYASQQDGKELIEHRREVIQAANVVSHMPIPLFVFNKQQLVTNASDSAVTYCGVESATLFGKPIFDNLNLEFQTESTLEKWLVDCQENRVTDTAYWEHVRVITPDGTRRQCDLAAYYNRENPSGADFIVTMFDRTEEYGEDDSSLGFIALAVHELRTPLTMLRGYIELFEEEIGPTLNGELHEFMLKMQASADQLTNFVRNILNVAKVENNQLSLQLTEADWPTSLAEFCKSMESRASLNKLSIEYHIDKDLPAVGIDMITIQEVVNNLLDNAIKYSVDSSDRRIVVTATKNSSGDIETTVQDFGVGIPESVLPNLFTKFYRNHRTKASVGGTGLGLYLCKAIIDAHEGEIWAKAKEGKGTTIGFTLQPFAKLADEKKSTNGQVIRQAHGWIKNHSYYRS